MLKFRLPPLLLLLLSKHPRGQIDDVLVSAVVSDHPTCPAAASHVALSAIHPYPLSAHVPEVTMGYTVCVCPRHTSITETNTAAQSAVGINHRHPGVGGFEILVVTLLSNDDDRCRGDGTESRTWTHVTARPS